MKNFKTKIESSDSNEEFNFECFENTEPIEIGDHFLFFFAGIADVGKCFSENEKYEINPNDRVRDHSKIDLVTGFWQKCYKIKSTNFDLSLID
jgi:hypothetical protein